MRISDVVFGVVLILAAAAIFLEAHTFPGMPGQSVGPALFPDIIAGGLALCGIGLLISGVRQSAGHRLVELGEWARSGGHILDVGLVIGGIVLLIVLWDQLGFLIGATLLTGGLITRFRGGSVLTSFGVALALCLIVDLSFRRLLLVPLPLGPLAGVMW
jgi:putative tricarboxylic transport membrane protein